MAFLAPPPQHVVFIKPDRRLEYGTGTQSRKELNPVFLRRAIFSLVAVFRSFVLISASRHVRRERQALLMLMNLTSSS
jgi:hypothetical protein